MRFSAANRRDRPGRVARRRRPLSAEVLERRDVPAAGPLGINVGVPEFVDAIKDTNGWQAPAVDARGWPTGDANIVVFDDRVNMPWNGPDPNAARPDMSGTYHLSFTGHADLWAYPASVQNPYYNPATNTTTADVVEPAGELFLEIGFMNTGGGVRDVKLIRPGYDPNTTQVFTNQYLEALRPFAAIRAMDATDTNNYGPEWAGRPLDWSQRHLPTDSGTGGDGEGRVGGASWEDLIQLANQVHTDLWINIPGPATDDYVTGLANLLKNGDTVDGFHYDRLDPSLKVYVEWSNEVWGGLDPTYNYNVADVQAQVQAGNSPLTSDGDPGTDTWRTGPTLLRNDLLHTERIAADFNAVFDDPNHDRIRPVLSWQGGNTWAFPATFGWFQSNFGAPSQYLYGMGGFTYYSPSDYSSVDNLLASLSAAEQSNIQGIRETTALANQYGLKNVSYEGGPGISATGDAGQVGLAALRDPRMEGIVAQSYFDWYANGGDLAMFYGGPYGIWGPQWPWAAAELGQAGNPSASPKYAGLMDVIRAGGGTTTQAPQLLATPSSPGEIDLSWTTVPGAAGYQLQGWAAGDSGQGEADLGAGTTTFRSTGLAVGTTYEYRVRAVDASGGPLTDWSTLASTTTGAVGVPLADAGFESTSVGSGNFGSFQYAPSGSPWSFAGYAGVSGNVSGFTVGNPDAPEGSLVAFLQMDGSFSQQVDGWAGGSYTISFAAAQRANIQASRQDFQVLVDGNVVGTFMPSGTDYSAYATATFAVGAGSHTITFKGLDSAGGDNTAFIDNVQLVAATT